ncbi:hypothetical protein [Staphylococcus intermedius]|uniref:hypothetical protein n=1 Tax=Staphylococcus intermedius TaxID=1285 RepID=UPI0002D3508D|nr:hypothetical protein [Staphylococcus intermedius]
MWAAGYRLKIVTNFTEETETNLSVMNHHYQWLFVFKSRGVNRYFYVKIERASKAV